MESEMRELGDMALIDQTMRTSIRELQSLVNKGKEVPMSEFTKIFLWARKRKEEVQTRELEIDRLHGWKIESRTWCGVPYNEFKIPSLGIV